MNDVAVCILADSSLNLASQWPAVISTYLSSLLGRLHEGRTSDSFHIAVVTYATADHRPKPIVATRYFNNPAFVTKEMKDDALRLGIGRTGSGSTMGMAALEGYAAVLELFDLFLASSRSTKEEKSSTEGQAGPLCHIIHISACHPDESQHPSWNQTTNLDTLTWKTLPDELRKRNINLNMIMLKSNKSFAELHSSANSETHKPWFKFPDTHTVLLSPAASWAQLTVKRASETTEPDKATDGKRARVSSPKPAPAIPPSQAPPPPPKTSESDPPPPPPSTGPSNPIPPIGLSHLQQVIAKMRELEPQIRQAQAQADMLRQQGRLQDMENLRRSTAPKMAMYIKLRQVMMAAQKAAASAGSANAQPGKPPETKPENVAGPSRQNQATPNAAPSATPSQPPQVAPTLPVQQAVQAQRQSQQASPGVPAAPVETRQTPNILPQISPNIAAQMQKLQAKEGISGLSAMPHHQPQPSLPQQSQQNNFPGQPMQAPSNPQQRQPPGLDGSQAWTGTITWINPQVMTTMEAQVRMIGNGNIQPNRWPARLEIEVLRDQKVSLPILKDWITRHGPVLCQVRAIPQNQENVLRFNSLSSLIHDRNTFAIGRRSPSSENPRPMMLLFSMGGNGTQLAAAVFPESGVPELPQATPNSNPNLQPAPTMPPPTASLPPTNNPQLIAMLQNMNPEQKLQFIARMQQRQLQAQAQQMAAAAGGNNPGGGGPPNPNANPVPNTLPNLPGGGWPVGGGMPGVGMGQGMPNVPPGLPAGMNLAQALAAMQQYQRQAGMQSRPGSGGPPPF